MASDNEDDDLDALREAALATLKQKVQPIENVFSGKNASRPQDSAAWADVPASIDLPVFSDPIPEQNHYPLPFEEPANQPPPTQHFFRPAINLPWNPAHHNRIPAFQNQRMRHPRFPQRSFGDVGGPMYDRGNRRFRPRGYLQPVHGRFPPGIHPANLSQPPQTPAGTTGMGANLIIIQPHKNETSSTSGSSLAETAPVKDSSTITCNKGSERSQSDNFQTSSKLVLPQDKYHSSDTTTTHRLDKEPEPEKKSKDKFSRYDKSDSEDDDDDDLSEVDDIANEIDKVLQDDFLAEEIAVQEAEETKAANKESEDVRKERQDSDKETEDVDSEPDDTDDKAESANKETEAADSETTVEEEVSERASPISSDKQEMGNDDHGLKTSAPAMSDISDTESLDLDALARDEPTGGDLDDLDSLVDKEPENVIDSSDIKHVIGRGNRKVSTNSHDSDSKKEFMNNFVDSAKKDNEIDKSNVENKQSPIRRRRSYSPDNHHSSTPPHYTNPMSPPRKSDSYNYRAPLSPRRSKSPFYNRHSSYRKSTSPRSSHRSRSRSPYHRKSPIRRASISPRRRGGSPNKSSVRRASISPRRRAGSPNNRRYEYSPRRYPMGRGRRRSLSPNRRARSPSPRDRYRMGRGNGRPYRDHYSNRPEENRHRESDRHYQDKERPRQVERDQSESKKEPDDKATDTEIKVSPLNKRKSPPVGKNNASQEKEKIKIDLEKLTPEERSKIEARRKKFDSKGEVNVTETSKKISLKDIKKREKKSKKKEKEVEKEEEVESLKVEEALPDVVNKKSSSKSGISLKKLRKKQESKKKKDEEEMEQESPRAVALAELEDESEDSDEGRSWRMESSGASGPAIKFGISRTSVSKAPLVSLDSMGDRGNRKDRESNRRRFTDYPEQRSRSERRMRDERRMYKSHKMQSNRWSSDEDSDSGGIQASRLSSSVVTSKPFKADIAPEKLCIQVHIAPKDSKKKSKAAPDFSNVYSVHAKRKRVPETVTSPSEEKEVEEEVVPVKKSKKKKEKKKKHKDENELYPDDLEIQDSNTKSPAKPSVLERLGKKVSLDSLEKKEKRKKKSKKNRDIDEDTDDLDLHILKMKAKNEEILRRQREIELDKERYG